MTNRAFRTVRGIHAELSSSHQTTFVEDQLSPVHEGQHLIGSPLAGSSSPDDISLVSALAQRRSGYAFDEIQPERAVVFELLHQAMGPQRTVTVRDQQHHLCRAPSAGGLPSIDAYVVARPTGELTPGVYRAQLRDDSPRLTAVRTGDPTVALRAGLDQEQFADRATIFVCLVARLDTTLTKYPARHYRTLHVDAGVALQNLYLVATSLGLPGCAVMGYDDAAMDQLLALPETAFTAVLFATGAPAPDRSVR